MELDKLTLQDFATLIGMMIFCAVMVAGAVLRRKRAVRKS